MNGINIMKQNQMENNFIFTNDVSKELNKIINDSHYVIICDDNTFDFINELNLKSKNIITIKSGEENKNIESVIYIWKQFEKYKCTRESIVINFGGGLVTDIGGFAASTFKRGMKFINIPTTLLGAVDASVGGKTGFNFDEHKNEIGVFAKPYYTIISTRFFQTLSDKELLSGYGEMLKHAFLIGNYPLLQIYMHENILQYKSESLFNMIKDNIKFKDNITREDFKESNIRKCLNFGHTFGHAIESLQIRKDEPLPHGYCIVYGMILEMIASYLIYKSIKKEDILEFIKYVNKNYGKYKISEDDKDIIIDLMRADKKNKKQDEIICVLFDENNCLVLNKEIDEVLLYTILDEYDSFLK